MLNRIRCKNCHNTLMIADIDEGVVEIKCTNKVCRLINRVECQSKVCIITTIGTAHNKAVDKLAMTTKM